ncbi:hypothetical protein GCM10009665_47760 [Kitasatospora nipponensis]|uniref:Uncharacterized protein n=1 Tax=Kitasatospora nipponensis TaxID=258049 RepID=A0ABN1WPV1_9ACTN
MSVPPGFEDDLMALSLVGCQLNGDEDGTRELLRVMEPRQLRAVAFNLVEMCVEAFRVEEEFGGPSLAETAERWQHLLADAQLRLLQADDHNPFEGFGED